MSKNPKSEIRNPKQSSKIQNSKSKTVWNFKNSNLEFVSNFDIRISKFQYQRGVILVFSLLVMAIIMSITFAVLGILIPKLKIASDPLKSVRALYAADSGMEWCLYANRGKPSPPAITATGPHLIGNGAAFIIYYPSAGFVQTATCASTQTPLDHRVVGTYQNVARSLEIH
ncbi:MAG: hypothetical protein Q8R55_00420 [Candidatus Taylorbacteria bacterium]|nr:hypothetical protein [Candidatus Taylorbacteria bacterium]